jgi:MFS family permease
LNPFQSGGFRWLWCSSLSTAVAQGIERTATAWLALSSTDSASGAFAVGLALAARMVPLLVLGLAAGTLADRFRKSRQLMLVAVVGMTCMAFFSWLTGIRSLQLWQVVALSFTAGCLQVFDTPARQALALETVPRDTATNAVALLALAARLFSAAGAFTAGVLISTSGVASCYAVIAVAWGLAAALVLAVRTVGASGVSLVRPAFWQALRDAARLVVDNRAVRTLTVASIACEVFAFSYMSAVPVFARDVLQVGAEGFGTLNAAAALGGSLAVIGLLALPGRVRREPVLGTVFVVYGAALLALAMTRDLAQTAAVLVVTGACAAAFDVLQQTLIQLAVPEGQRGRAMGVWLFGIGSAPVGHIEMGVLASSFGAPAALLFNGTLVAAAAAALLVRSASYRWHGQSPL